MITALVLISGRGSNLKALIEATRSPSFRCEIKAVISNRENTPGLQYLEGTEIKFTVLSDQDYADRSAYDTALSTVIDKHNPDLILLAGFMRVLSSELVRRYYGRLLNIHPSLLPKYKGLNTHARVLAAGEQLHGASVHFVTEELDGGPVILQATVPIQVDDTEETLAARVLQKEHVIYPMVVSWFAEGRLAMGPEGPMFDGVLLDTPLQLEAL